MKHILIFKKLTKEGKDLYTFEFEKQESFEWISGQHGTLMFTKELEDDTGKRVLSIASSQNEKLVKFVLKIEDQRSAYKEALLHLEEGDEMQFIGPVGKFYITEKEKPHVCIAGGVGVAPFRPMLHDIANGISNTTVELVYASTAGNFAYKEDFDNFAKHDNVTVHYAENRTDAQAITKELIEKYKDEASYCISGAPSMVDEYKEIFLEDGIKEEQIILDIFTGY